MLLSAQVADSASSALSCLAVEAQQHDASAAKSLQQQPDCLLHTRPIQEIDPNSSSAVVTNVGRSMS
jgi:ABC-type phosphate/phosphonate transport system ATPase subunit